jgi:Arabinose efflux permease
LDVARSNRVRLICAQLLCGVGIASGVAVGGLLAVAVSGSVGAAGFAQTAVVVGAGIVAVPLARLAARRGRRLSLTLGFTLAALGAVLILVAVASMQFWLLLLGMLLFGSGTATNLQSRYAATELVEPRHQARAMSIVLWATTVGSVAGPNLSEPGSRLGFAIGIDPLSGPYLFSVTAFALAAVVTSTLRMGAPAAGGQAGAASAGRAGDGRASEASAARRPVGALAALRLAVRNPRALFGLVAIVSGQMMMTSVMVMTPVSMNHEGMSLELVGLVISIHVVGMYAASPLFGWLADRLGAGWVACLGAALFVMAFVLGALDATAPHSEVGRVMVALCLLGLGWSASIIGGSTMLTQSVSSETKVPLQGAVDSLMNFGAAALAALAGPILAFGGFFAVNVMAACILVPFVVLGIRARLRDRPEPIVTIATSTPQPEER